MVVWVVLVFEELIEAVLVRSFECTGPALHSADHRVSEGVVLHDRPDWSNACGAFMLLLLKDDHRAHAWVLLRLQRRYCPLKLLLLFTMARCRRKWRSKATTDDNK